MRNRQIPAKPPGGYDALHLMDWPIFESSNEWGIPDRLPAVALPAGGRLIGYRERVKPTHKDCLHCFLDDYRFETTWNRPKQAARHVTRFKHAVSPDFSQFPEFPAMANMWQTYRSAWVSRYWQELGLNVIPAPNWTGSNPAPWQFAGIPAGCPVAVQVPGLADPHTLQRFAGGYRAMCNALEPSLVYIMGNLPAQLVRLAPVIHVPTFTEGLRSRLSVVPHPAEK